MDWLWIPITVWAALAQTVRNAAQRSLVASLGTLGATLVRFLYGLPFALLWLAAVAAATGEPMPQLEPAFFAWVALGALAQIAATALLLAAMQERNFALGVAYSKTEVLQTAVFATVFLGDPLGAIGATAVLAATLGVLLLSPVDRERPLRTLLEGWTSRASLLGIGSGAGFALAAVGYRGAALALPGSGFLIAAAAALAAAQLLQTLALGGFLALRDPGAIAGALREWRRSLVAGFMGAAASAGWFTAFALAPAAHVRTLGLVELVFSYAVSRRFFRERLTRLEAAGMWLLALGVGAIAFAG